MKYKKNIPLILIVIFLTSFSFYFYKNYTQNKDALRNTVNFRASEYKKKGDEGVLQKDYLSAIDNYKKAIEKNNNYLPALINLGNLLRDTENYDSAFDYLERAYTIDRKNKDTLAGIIRLFLKTRDITKAEQYIKESIKEHPYDAELNFLQAECHLLKRNYYQAKSKYKEVLNWDPNYYQALLGLSKIATKENNFNQAEEYLKQAKQISPESPEIFIALSQTLLHKALVKQEHLLYDEPLDIDIFSEALTELQNARSYNPQNIEVNLLAAKIFTLSKKCDEAIQYLNDILEIVPNHFEALYYMGFCDPQKSLEIYPKLLKLSDEDDLINYQLEKNLLTLNTSRESPEIIEHTKKHFSMSNQFSELGEQGKSMYELKWSLYLMPNFIKSHQELLNHYRVQTNFIELQKTLDFLRSTSNDTKYQDMYEQFIELRKNKIYYKENIRNLESIKSSTPLFVFYFKPTNPFGTFPDAGEAIAEKLSFALSHKGRIKIASKLERDNLGNILTKQNYFGVGGYYNNQLAKLVQIEMNQYLNQIIQDNKSENPFAIDPEELRYIISGTYTEIPRGIKVDLKIIDLRNGLVVSELSASGSGRGYLSSISVYIANQIYNNIPFKGKILKIQSNSVLINLGTHDGISKDTIFNVKSNSKIYQLKPTEIDTELCWANFKDPSYFYQIKVGDEVRTNINPNNSFKKQE